MATKTQSPMSFLNYAVEGFLDGLKLQIDKIREIQRDMTWERLVYDHFKDSTTEPDKRRRDLLLALSKFESVALAMVPNITPQIAREYAKVSVRTPMRDLRKLEEENLLLLSARYAKPNKELIKSFLPIRKSSSITPPV